jgi:hypothetical protein
MSQIMTTKYLHIPNTNNSHFSISKKKKTNIFYKKIDISNKRVEQICFKKKIRTNIIFLLKFSLKGQSLKYGIVNRKQILLQLHNNNNLKKGKECV